MSGLPGINLPSLTQLTAPLPAINNSQYFAYNGIIFDWMQFETPENLELAWRVLGGVEDIPTSSGVPAQRVSQTLGVVMDTIKFEASFIGPGAVTKARALEALLAMTGPFQFGGRIIQCVLFGLTEIYRTINDIRYSVTLEPTYETTSGAPAAGSSATAALQSNVNAIANYPAANTPALLQLNAVPPAISVASSTSIPGASLSTLQSLSSTFQSANVQLQSLMASKSGSVVPGDVQTYLGAAGLVGLLSTAISTLGSFTGVTGTSVAVSGANMYQLAARYTGDVNNVDTIMSANGITDPFNPGVASIIIPSVLKAI